MAAPSYLPTAPFNYFDQAAFSDITIIYGQESVKCHKVILCQQSDYFRKMLGPDSKFAERDAGSVVLEGDDPVALRALFRWIYTFSYEEDAHEDDHMYHLRVALVAQKYLIAKLQAQATASFEKLVMRVDDLDHLFEIITIVQTEASNDQSLMRVAINLAKRNLLDLLHVPEFRAMLKNDGRFSYSIIRKLSFAANLEPFEKSYTCPTCYAGEAVQIYGGKCVVCGNRGEPRSPLQQVSCWTEDDF